jgi:hypothetical protein
VPSTITETESRGRRDQAQQLLARRREDIRRIRKRVIAGSAVAFVTAWAAIGVQLASGHDPALNKRAQPVAAPSASSTSSTTDSTSSDATPTNDTTQTTPPSASPSQQLAPVTTQQS